jgi:hypothetical protein
MSDVQLDRIEARLRTLTILLQRTRLQVERVGDDLADLIITIKTLPPESATRREDGTV